MAFPNEKEAAVITGMNAAFRYYGALPERIMVDNMRTAVTKNKDYEVVLNPSFEDIEKFYDTPVIPARPHSPSDKGSVESAVKYTEGNIISYLETEGFVFDSFEALNVKVRELVDELNEDTREGRRDVSRSEMFEKIDLPVMRPLPSGKVDAYTYHTRKVNNNCHIQYDKHNYSVPFKWASKEVIVKAGIDDLIICSPDNEKICTHRLNTDPQNKYTTVPEHLPKSMNEVTESLKRTEKDYIRWAERIGPDMKEFITRILNRADYVQKAYRSCEGILHKCTGQPNEVGNRAAGKCMEKNIYTVKGYKAEFEDQKKLLNEVSHQNIRGGGYYR